MGYVQSVLQPGEQVRHISSIHWIVYWPGVAVALLAVVAYWLGDTRLLPGFWRYTAYALAVVAVVLLRSGRTGHWGLSGMRERAEAIGARLNVRSRASAGTEVDLSVPGRTAFQLRPSGLPKRPFFGSYWRKARPGTIEVRNVTDE